MIHLYEGTIIKLRQKVLTEKYSSFKFIDVVGDPSDCMKFISGCFANFGNIEIKA